jgi:hypothetical protein
VSIGSVRSDASVSAGVPMASFSSAGRQSCWLSVSLLTFDTVLVPRLAASAFSILCGEGDSWVADGDAGLEMLGPGDVGLEQCV